MKKSRLLSMVLCAELAMAGAIVPLLANKVWKSHKTRPVQYSNELVVNTSNKYQTITKKDEKQGILDLNNLVHDSHEEAWVYLPKKQEWVEVGVSESNSKASISQRELDTLLQNNDEITPYHTHPFEWSPSSESLPSPADIEVMINTSKDFYNNHPNGKYTEKIGSAYGITEYKLTKEGIDYIKEKNLNRFETFHLAKEMCKSIKVVKFNVVDTDNYGLKYEMQLKVNDPKLEVIYTPHNQIKFKE